MCCDSKLTVKRNYLIEISRVARSLRSAEEIDGSINYVLLNYIYNTGNANEFKTFKEWQDEGYGVRKGAKAFIAWGKPVKRTGDDGKELKYFPVRHLFSDKQVYRVKERGVAETNAEYGNFVGRIKVSYVREKEIKRKRLDSSEQIAEVCSEIWDPEEIGYRESFYVIALNNRCDLLGYAKLFEGGISSTLIDERVVFQLLLNVNASAFIVAHNHPSGNLVPSNDDIRLTESLKRCANMMKIDLLDHLIITPDENYYSFSDNGRM